MLFQLLLLVEGSYNLNQKQEDLLLWDKGKVEVQAGLLDNG